MSEDRQVIALVEEAKRRGFNVDGLNLLDGLFDKQLAFVMDEAKRVAGVCSRRAGKTYMMPRLCSQTCLDNPGSRVVYLARTRDQAKKLVWGPLKRLVFVRKLGCEFRETELRCIFPNGSELWLAGADKADDIEKLRGHSFHLCVLDEAQSFGRHVESLIDEVLDPALAENRGTLILIGTPNATKTGFFYEVTEGKLAPYWSVHRWTLLDNPMFPEFVHYREENPDGDWQKYARTWLKTHMESHGWSPDNPKYQREWLGRWVVDRENRVYHRFDSERNTVRALPDGEFEHILGIDFGYEDATAFVDASYTRYEPYVYFSRGVKRSHMTITDIVDEIKRRMRDRTYQRIVADCAGAGKMIAMEITKRHGIHVKSADKREKHAAIELLNSDFHEGKALVVTPNQLTVELSELQWAPGDGRYENPSQDNHLADAALYAYKECFHYICEPRPEKPRPGSQEWADKDVAAMDAENMGVGNEQEWWLPSRWA